MKIYKPIRTRTPAVGSAKIIGEWTSGGRSPTVGTIAPVVAIGSAAEKAGSGKIFQIKTKRHLDAGGAEGRPSRHKKGRIDHWSKYSGFELSIAPLRRECRLCRRENHLALTAARGQMRREQKVQKCSCAQQSLAPLKTAKGRPSLVSHGMRRFCAHRSCCCQNVSR